jgi:hypothetical protein
MRAIGGALLMGAALRAANVHIAQNDSGAREGAAKRAFEVHIRRMPSSVVSRGGDAEGPVDVRGSRTRIATEEARDVLAASGVSSGARTRSTCLLGFCDLPDPAVG